jgi:GNAT superfamily N-acetyltransferase
MLVDGLRIEKAALDDADAVPLTAALDAESQSRYPFDLSKHFRVSPEEFSGDRGAFLLAYVGEEPVGCGAVRLLEAGDAELKRMYVVPRVRGQGVARAVLAALEEEARRLGAKRLILETGNKQVEALALYRREGFVEIPRYEPYVEAQHSICMAKPLVV